MGVIINGYDLDDVFGDNMIFFSHHSCHIHKVDEIVITLKASFQNNDYHSMEWFECHLFDQRKGFVDELIKRLILWRLRENNQEKIEFTKEELEKYFKEKKEGA